MRKEYGESIQSSFPTLASKQAFLIGLLEKCPMNKALDNCPAYGLRELPVTEKIDMVLEMDEGKLDELITHHMECMEQKPH